MTDRIDPQQFEIGHRIFLDFMLDRSGGVRFEHFQHPVLVEREVKYKQEVYRRASRVLALNRWKDWRYRSPNQIRKAVREACNPSNCNNLLEHRYSDRTKSASPIYLVSSPEQIEALEEELYYLLLGGGSEPTSFGSRFDRFASYLRQQRLGCKWPFVSYLAFLFDPETYFPVHSGAFERLAHFYGLNVKIKHNITWQAYAVLLDLADELRFRLKRRVNQNPTLIEVHSYMWVVARQISSLSDQPTPPPRPPNFEQEMEKRIKRAERDAVNHERIGLEGERYIFEKEQEKLRTAGYGKWADCVRHIAAEDSKAGYDVLSFDLDGNELHIEVKTTLRSREMDAGFFLSENERAKASEDEKWRLYRVWGIQDSPYHDDLGNLVREPTAQWTLVPDNWRVKPDAFSD